MVGMTILNTGLSTHVFAQQPHRLPLQSSSAESLKEWVGSTLLISDYKYQSYLLLAGTPSAYLYVIYRVSPVMRLSNILVGLLQVPSQYLQVGVSHQLLEAVDIHSTS
jgi:hypothetical protein